MHTPRDGGANSRQAVIDTLIAATVMVHGLTLVTRSTRDVAASGVPLVDPWQVR